MIIKSHFPDDNCKFEKATQLQLTSSRLKMEITKKFMRFAESLKTINGKTKTMCEICFN